MVVLSMCVDTREPMFTVPDDDCGRGNRRRVEDDGVALTDGTADALLCLVEATLGAATGGDTSVRRGGGGVSLDLFVTYVCDHRSVALLMDSTGFHCKAGAVAKY